MPVPLHLFLLQNSELSLSLSVNLALALLCFFNSLLDNLLRFSVNFGFESAALQLNFFFGLLIYLVVLGLLG